MVAAGIIMLVVALAVGIGLGWYFTRHAPVVTPIQADPAVVQLYAAKRAALQKEAPNASPLPPAELVAALRGMAR